MQPLVVRETSNVSNNEVWASVMNACEGPGLATTSIERCFLEVGPNDDGNTSLDPQPLLLRPSSFHTLDTAT